MGCCRFSDVCGLNGWLVWKRLGGVIGVVRGNARNRRGLDMGGGHPVTACE